jgi:hypothetical protein
MRYNTMMDEQERKKRKSDRGKAYYSANKEKINARTNKNRRIRKIDPTYRERERAKRKERARKEKEVYKQIILDAKKVGCLYCDEKHPAALDFHHRDPSQKTYNISNWVRFTNPKRLLEEIAKCDVICANCHRKLHHEENT